jgi:antitoxin component of MazEF toxin-antitoxin module
MAAVTFAARFAADGSLTIPDEAVETLKLNPGDEITVRLETGVGVPETEQLTQDEYLRRITRLFEEADTLVREPGKPLTDPYEAAWAAGVEEKARRIGLKL